MKIYSIMIVVWFGLQQFAYAQSKTIQTTAVISSATIYQNQAEITHKVKVYIPQGQHELVISPISSFAFANTIQINGGRGMAVLSTRLEQESQLKPEKGILKIYNDSLILLETQFRKLNNTLQIISSQREALENSEVVTKAGFSAIETGNFLDFQKQRLAALFDERFAVHKQIELVETKISQVKSILQTELAKNTHLLGKVILQVQANYASEQILTVTYLTSHAQWTPLYDLRVENFEKPLELVYQAKILQYTGLPLQNIPIRLSSGTPSTYTNLPTLSPRFLRFVQPVKENLDDANNYQRSKSFSGASATVPKPNYDDVEVKGIGSVQAKNVPLYMVDGYEVSSVNALAIPADRIKSMDVLKDAAATKMYGNRAANGVVLITTKTTVGATVDNNAINTELVYVIDDNVSLPSDPNAKYITLKTTEVKANYLYTMWPAKASTAFAVATIPSWEKLQLLPGDAKIYWQNSLVGNTSIGTTNASDSLAVNLGIDKRLAITKTKQQDYTKIRSLGSNLQQAFTYVLTVRNNKTVPHTVTVFDQVPISSSSEIEIANVELSGGVMNSETGMVEWIISLAPGEQKILRVSYTVKYPKDKSIQWE
jgi:TonB-dependent SusC/RagA subfamily outer membrane receptor